MRRLNKEYKLDVCNHISVKYGTVNRDDPQVVYVSGKCWVSPNYEMDYGDVMYDIEKKMRKNIKMFMTDGINFDKKYILDFDINTDKMAPNEKKFLSFNFYLKQNNKNKRKLKELRELMDNKVSTIANGLVYTFNDNDFTISKTKR